MDRFNGVDYHSLSRSDKKQFRDERAKKIKIGDWVRFNPTLANYFGKLAVIVSWDDSDGHNHKRARRNKIVIAHVDPHIHDEPVIFRGRLQEFEPISEMEVLAECARDRDG